jgi:hypothetical protein
MSQHDYDITAEDAVSGLLFRAAVNAALKALASNNLGGSAPSTTYAGMFWADTENDMMWIRNAGNTAWIAVGSLSSGLLSITDKYAEDTGAVNAYMITLNPAPTTHNEGLPIMFKATYANTGASTITINGLAEKNIKKNGSSALEAGDIAAGQIVTVVYDGTNYQLMTPSAKLPADLIALQANTVPVGSIVAYPSETAPTGWLECNGQAISRTTYAALYAVIGTRYGTGDGSTTFNVPDYRGYFLRGWNHGAGVDPDASARTNSGDGTSGDHVGTKQDDDYKSHRHKAGKGTGTHDEMYGSGGLCGDGQAADTYTDYSGNNETRPKNINVMYCIKY